MSRQAFELGGQQQAFDDYLFAVDQTDPRVDTLTAVGLVCEVGDFQWRDAPVYD